MHNGGKRSKSARTATAKFKLVTLGHAGVGKTSLILRYTNGVFDPAYHTTVGVDFFVKHLVVLGHDVDVQIWDTAGQERFRAVSKSLYRGMQGVLLIFDVCDVASFRTVSQWMLDIRATEGEGVPMILVGNKADRKLDRIVSVEQGRSKADEMRLPYYETSARDGTGVADAFEALITSVVLQQFPTGLPPPPPDAADGKSKASLAAAASAVVATSALGRPKAAGGSSAAAAASAPSVMERKPARTASPPSRPKLRVTRASSSGSVMDEDDDDNESKAGGCAC